MRITGRGGTTLADKWADGPTTFLGVQVAGFPNFFIVSGPQGYNPLTNLRCDRPLPRRAPPPKLRRVCAGRARAHAYADPLPCTGRLRVAAFATRRQVIEDQARWIAGAIASTRGRQEQAGGGRVVVDARPEAEAEYTAWCNSIVPKTVWSGCNNWCVGPGGGGQCRSSVTEGGSAGAA